MKVLIIVALFAVAAASVEKKEKRGILNTGYHYDDFNHRPLAPEPLTLGHPSISEYSLPSLHQVPVASHLPSEVDAYAAPVFEEFVARAPLVTKAIPAPLPIIQETALVARAPIYQAPRFAKIAPVPLPAPFVPSRIYSQPIASPLYHAPSPLVSKPVVPQVATSAIYSRLFNPPVLSKIASPSLGRTYLPPAPVQALDNDGYHY